MAVLNLRKGSKEAYVYYLLLAQADLKSNEVVFETTPENKHKFISGLAVLKQMNVVAKLGKNKLLFNPWYVRPVGDEAHFNKIKLRWLEVTYKSY